MGLKLPLLVFGLLILLLEGCYPGEIETYEETDIVVTNYNEEYK